MTNEVKDDPVRRAAEEMGGEVKVQAPPGIGAMVTAYAADFSLALPRHLSGEQWIRQTQAALRKNSGIQQAANNNPPQALRVLMECARLGHVPGTDEYYLIPRGNQDLGYEEYVNRRGETKKRKRQELTGIEGYKGIVARILRAGKASAVVVELVRKGDVFAYNPGLHERPQHEADWFGGDRGEVIGGYAYAKMKDGQTSRVVIMDVDEINSHRERSDSWKNHWSRDSSPWTTDWDKMALKTLARGLEPWVLKSSEDVEYQTRIAEAEVANRAAVEMPEAPEEAIEAEIVPEDDSEAEEPDAQPDSH